MTTAVHYAVPVTFEDGEPALPYKCKRCGKLIELRRKEEYRFWQHIDNPKEVTS